ncbi:N-(5'-phosphoribosyl)anthranilate isomerase [Capnocytophaga cynodegmi]|uniref:phosphoribosylanthranilate isomerase n=1 Tax=Capnocytophaga cynodegmi TaxID=28189 RepID=UPI001AD2B177|nr:phosphoribosylanthranilate isomerase [Capnocytophaga cynodegmi]GIM53125.1 N-(5'-phosphoribosyl)anthranilate isomerase [Capnocytophaga cynodegmi]
MSLKLKVCGLTLENQIEDLIALNIDFLGFIFYEKSPRFALKNLSLNKLRNFEHTGKIGVFVNESLEKVLEISEKSSLNFVQLHGDETPNFVENLRKKLNPEIKIIKVVRVNSAGIKIPENIDEIDFLLFDTDSKSYGGTGKTFPWQQLNNIEIPLPFFLSGGISLENIKNIEKITTKPFSLDINSKFESEAGIKDLTKIKQIKHYVDNFNKLK